MLSVRPKITTLNCHLFGKVVHPELFQICNSRSVTRENYQLDIRITTDGHVLTFQHGPFLLTEVSAAKSRSLPSDRLLISHPVEALTNDRLVHRDVIEYQNELKLESVPPEMFVLIAQQLDEKVECEGLVHRFGSNGRLAFGAISYINVQSFNAHVNVRCLHTFPESCAVLKSETQFRVLQPTSNSGSSEVPY